MNPAARQQRPDATPPCRAEDRQPAVRSGVRRANGAAVRRTAARSNAVCKTAVRRTLRVLAPLAIVAALTSVLAVAGARADALVLPWIGSVLWALAAGVVEALDRWLGHGDRSAVAHRPGEPERRSREDGHDFTLKSGEYAYLRIRESYDTLYDDGHLFSQAADLTGTVD